MSEPNSTEADPMAGLRAVLDDLLCIDFAAFSPSELIDLASEWEVELRRAAMVTHTIVAALGSTGAPGEFEYRDVAALLVDVLRLGAGEAKSRVRTADLVAERRSLTGELLAPTFPAIAEAQRAGQVSGEHVAVILRALDSLPLSTDSAVVSSVEQSLVTLAGQVGPRRLAVAAQRVVALADPDGARTAETEQQRHRSLTLTSQPDGSGHLRGRLTPELLAVLRTVLDPLSAPAPHDDGVPDPRTAEQRRHDGLLDLCQRTLRSGELPATGGVPTTLILTMTEKEFRQRRGFASTVHGDLVPAETVGRLADQADIFAVLVDSGGGVLSYGRTRRLASPAQRCVLYARDGGCTFPGCSTPASWCQVHNVLDWLYGGDTSIENMALLCGHHHRTFEPAGWRVIMRDGAPWWIPPPHIDHQQIPRQNLYWRTPQLC